MQQNKPPDAPAYRAVCFVGLVIYLVNRECIFRRSTMKLRLAYLFLTSALLAVAACQQNPYGAPPKASDSVGVVGTFVSAKVLQLTGRQAYIVAMAFDSAGNLYGADRASNRVLKITADGTVSTLAGDGTAGYANGAGAFARFAGLASLAVDRRGAVYVGEGYPNACIRKITPDGQVSPFVGAPFDLLALPFYPETPADNTGEKARFIAPISLVFDQADNLLVADVSSVGYYVHNAIRQVTPGGDVRTLVGDVSGMPRQGRVVDGAPLPYKFLQLAVDQTNTLIGIENSRYGLYQIRRNGDMSAYRSASLSYPSSLLYDSNDRLLLGTGSKILRIDATGFSTTLTGSDSQGFVNDSLKLARFGSISAMAIGPRNVLYIADSDNQCIRRVRLN
jgi:hypothetical protein